MLILGDLYLKTYSYDMNMMRMTITMTTLKTFTKTTKKSTTEMTAKTATNTIQPQSVDISSS